MGLFSTLRSLALQQFRTTTTTVAPTIAPTTSTLGAPAPTAPAVTPEDTQVTTSSEPQSDAGFKATGQYTKERRLRSRFQPSIFNGVIQRGSLRAGGDPLQPEIQRVPGPQIRFSVNDISRASYTYKGTFGFDNAEYEFVIKATNRFRVLVDGKTIIDDYVTGATRTRTHTTAITAGIHEVTVIWSPTGQNTLDFDFKRLFKISWISCVDGQEREGGPPDNWTKTSSGCFKPPLTDDDGVVDLLQVIDISPDPDSRIERAYVLGSGAALSRHRLKFFNRSSNMTLGVKLRGPKPVRFVTARTLVGDVGIGGLPGRAFELGTQQTKEIDVVFIQSELDALPEGILRSDILVAVNAGTITLTKDDDDIIDIGPPDPDDPDQPDDPDDPIILPPPPPTPTWRDCSKGGDRVRDGFPPSDWTIRSDGCYVPPVIEPPPVSFVITSIEFPATSVDANPIATAQLNPIITGGVAAWSYKWNFDVNRQGFGTGDTAGRQPTVRWKMTQNDHLALLNQGRTTRVVEAIATRRFGTQAGQIVRVKHTVVLDDPNLRFQQRNEDFSFDESDEAFEF